MNIKQLSHAVSGLTNPHVSDDVISSVYQALENLSKLLVFILLSAIPEIARSDSPSKERGHPS